MSSTPTISRYVLEHGESEPVFIQVVSFPQGHIMVWIGTKETKMDNLVFSIGDQRLADPKKSVLSTTLKSSTLNDGFASSLSLKLSKRLKGRPVYLSSSLDTLTNDDNFVCHLEKSLFKHISEHPEKFA